jgi:hypothetical protein
LAFINSIIIIPTIIVKKVVAIIFGAASVFALFILEMHEQKMFIFA